MLDNQMQASARMETASDQVTVGVHAPRALPAAEGAASDSPAGGHALDWLDIVCIGFVAVAATKTAGSICGRA